MGIGMYIYWLTLTWLTKNLFKVHCLQGLIVKAINLDHDAMQGHTKGKMGDTGTSTGT